MRHISFFAGLICVMFAYQDAHAQAFWYLPPGGDFSYRYGIDLGNGFGYGIGFGFGYGAAQSPDSAAAAAYADLIRLQGQFNVMQLPVPVNQGQANVQEALNQQQQVVQDVEQQPSSQPQAELAKKAMAAPGRSKPGHASAAAASRTTPIEFDRSTGRVVWPAVLTGDAFSDRRSEMETLLKSASQKGVTSELRALIKDKAQEMHDTLRGHFRMISTKEYLEGHRFINRLAIEGQTPMT